jgi:hypothetical protein
MILVERQSWMILATAGCLVTMSASAQDRKDPQST